MTESKKTESKPKKEKVASKPSTVAKPVAVVRELAEKMTKTDPKVARKDVIAAAVAKGVNRSTASTQWQMWRKPKAKKAAAK